jgi:hypothetical protein
MVNARVARVGILAVGLGIGAAVAHTPVASADTSTDWLSSIDSLLGGAVPAADSTSTLDFQISIDGKDLFPTTGNLATATSGTNDIAIAYGDGANASAAGGTGDYALASGTNALANAGGLSSDTGANGDTAIDIGNNAAPINGSPDGAYAGNADVIGNGSGGTGINDTAIDIGNNTNTATLGGNEGAFAGAGGLIGATGNGNNDTAIIFGNESGASNGPAAVDGNYDSASGYGNETGQNIGSLAGHGNYDSASGYGNETGYEIGALAGYGNNDTASVIGGTSSATAGGDYTGATGDVGNNDIAYVLDPWGTDGSNANAGFDSITGLTGNSDLAAVLGVDNVTANAVGANDLVDILPTLGAEATNGSTHFLTDLLSLF